MPNKTEVPIERLLQDAKLKIERFAGFLQAAKMTGKIVIEINMSSGGIGSTTIQVFPGKEKVK